MKIIKTLKANLQRRRRARLVARDMARMAEQARQPFAEDAREAARDSLAAGPASEPSRNWRGMVESNARPGDVANLIMERDALRAALDLADDARAEKVGAALAAALLLEPIPPRRKDWPGESVRYQTVWGTKTAIGLARTVARLIQEGGAL